MSLTREHPKLFCPVFLLSGVLFALVPSANSQPTSHLQVPPGFTVELAAGAPHLQFPMFAAFDERGRLYVAESSGLDLYAELQAQTRKCRVRVLEDHDEDGRFESSGIFADQLVFPMGLAWRAGKLYVADPPDLAVYEDTDGDGAADKRTVILTGFGHRDNGSLHGLVFGPDGWLYMTMGSPDGYRLERPDGSFLEGESGALIRCRSDGSDPQVLCRGFENLVEIVFTPRGEIIGTDNWFRNVNEAGSEGLRDALVHLVDGGLYPYHREVGTPQPVTGDPLGPVSLFPAVALSGLVQERGPTFPAEYRGNLFSAQHNARKVGRHVLMPDGSTFRSLDFDFLTSTSPDFHPSDVLQAADGSLLVVDTGSWYTHHCPTGNIRQSPAPGGIYRVRWEDASAVPDPWGNAEDWPSASHERLIALLADERPAVGDRAGDALVLLGEAVVDPLVAALEDSSDQATTQRIIWTLATIPNERARRAVRSALDDADDVAATAARALASLHDRDAFRGLHDLLARDASHIRLAAAEALATCGTSESLPVLWQAFAGEPDRFLEHALMHAIHHLADAEALRPALANEHPRVQTAALLLLDQPPRPPGSLSQEAVLACVSSADAQLQRTAVRILQRHPEWTQSAVELVRSFLLDAQPSQQQRQSLHDMILALQSQPALQEVVAASLAAPIERRSAERQVDLLLTLSECGLTSPPASWIEAIGRAIDSENAAIRAATIHTAAVWQIPEFDESLARIADSDDQPTELRMDALAAVLVRRREIPPGVFAMLIEQLASDDPLSRLRAAELAGRADLSYAQLEELLRVVADDALVSPSVLLPALQRSTRADTLGMILAYLKRSLEQGWRPPPAQFAEVLRFLSTSDADARGLLSLVEQSAQDLRGELTKYEPLLGGGHPDRGRQVFFGGKVACGSCHRIGSEGGNVGPDLTRIGTVRSGRDLVESIVYPSSTFAQGYESYLVTTMGGRMLAGTIVVQSADLVVLRDSSGKRHRLVKDDVELLERHGASLMPSGLAQAMTRQEFQDLLAFLQTLK